MGDERTGVELLREAAALMRERARRAAHFTPPWTVEPRTDNGGFTIRYSTSHPLAGALVSCPDYVGLDTADHIASWHPGVALAVADWLDKEAEGIESGNWRPCVEYATAAARVYLSAPVSAGEPKENT